MFRNPLSGISRNTKIDLAALALGGSSIVVEMVYYPSPTLLLNAVSILRTGAMSLIGAEVLKRIVNGPQDAKVTTVATEA